MKKAVLAILVLALAAPMWAATYKSVSLMDAGCAAKADVMAHPEKHKKSCAMQCAKSGYGAIVDGKFVKFDKKGNDLAAAALKKSSKTENLRASIDGEIKDGVLHVKTLKLD